MSIRNFMPLGWGVKAICLAGVMLLAGGCQKKPQQKNEGQPGAKAEAIMSATPSPQAATPTPTPVHKSGEVAVIGYHRFENTPHDPLAITPQQFREQMQAIKDSGITVIPMKDMISWLHGQKDIPDRAAVITIDDGYNDAYSAAWPILKEFGYPFTYFVYTNYINAGGRSITWDQLREMRDAGVDIECHSMSHDNMVKPRHSKNPNYDEWLKDELGTSKDIIEKNLGIKVVAFAYPFGIYNQHVVDEAKKYGYEAMFTVDGKHIRFGDNPMQLGRYIVQSTIPSTFTSALKFGPNLGTAIAGGSSSSAAGAAVPVTNADIGFLPENGSTIVDPTPTISADVSAVQDIDPKSIRMFISGLGEVPATYDPVKAVITYHIPQRLHNGTTTVQLELKAGGKEVQAAWEFNYDEAKALGEKVAPSPSPSANSHPQHTN